MKEQEPKRPMRIFREQLYSLSEAATALRCNMRTIYNYREQGRFKAVRIGGRYMIPGGELLHIKEHGLREPTAAYKKQAAAAKAAYRDRRRSGAPKMNAGGRPLKDGAKAPSGRPRAKGRT